MKRAFTPVALLSLVAALTVVAAAPANAAPSSITILDFSYTIDVTDIGAGASVTAYTGDLDAVIPATISWGGDDYAVTAITEYAFYNLGLTSVVIPESVTAIGSGAFLDNDLTTVTIPSGITVIEGAVFMGNDLVSVNIPDGVTSIGPDAFKFADLTAITLPDSVTFIGEGAFIFNPLTSLTIPPNVTNIGQSAFRYSDLSTLVIPSSVTSILNRAFSDNLNLTQVKFLGSAPLVMGTDVFTSDPLVSFQNRYNSLLVADGFTTPSWFGYRTQALVPVEFFANDDTMASSLQDAALGELLTVDTEPTRDGYTFAGWYTEETGGTLWNLSTDIVTGDLTLYAHWDIVTDGGPVTDGGTDGGAVGASPVAATALADTGPAPLLPLSFAGLLLLLGTALLPRTRRTSAP